jgi:hypothetical protein
MEKARLILHHQAVDSKKSLSDSGSFKINPSGEFWWILISSILGGLGCLKGRHVIKDISVGTWGYVTDGCTAVWLRVKSSASERAPLLPRRNHLNINTVDVDLGEEN